MLPQPQKDMPFRRKFLLAAIAALSNSATGWMPPTSGRNPKRMLTNIYAYLDDQSSPVNGNRHSNAIESKTDYTGAGTLGDIMSKQSAESGLVTTEGGLLSSKFGIESPLDRMALTANGNLQRLFSSYYDAPVHVVVDKCNQDSKHTWNRLVHLTVHDQKFCTAQSRITVHDDECCRLVESQRVGLGQLFRHLDKLPSFNLLDAGYSEQGGLWRVYELECRELTCHIEETFAPDMWNIQKL